MKNVGRRTSSFADPKAVVVWQIATAPRRAEAVRHGSIAGARIRTGSAPNMKYNHVGIPTAGSFEGEIPLPHLKLTVSDHTNNPFGIQWQRYWEGAPYPDLVKTVAHVAFEVDGLEAAIKGQKVIIEPNSPSLGVVVAFIEVNGAPVELLQVDRTIRDDA
jgi:hypothetical protein